jgi:hypothetical protein
MAFTRRGFLKGLFGVAAAAGLSKIIPEVPVEAVKLEPLRGVSVDGGGFEATDDFSTSCHATVDFISYRKVPVYYTLAGRGGR